MRHTASNSIIHEVLFLGELLLSKRVLPLSSWHIDAFILADSVLSRSRNTPLQGIQVYLVSLRQSLARFEAGADLRTCSPVSAEQGIGFEAIIQIYF